MVWDRSRRYLSPDSAGTDSKGWINMLEPLIMHCTTTEKRKLSPPAALIKQGSATPIHYLTGVGLTGAGIASLHYQ